MRQKYPFEKTALPTKKKILKRVLYLIQYEKICVKKCAFIVAIEILSIYQSFNILTKRKDSIHRSVLQIYTNYNKARKNKKYFCEIKYINSLDTLFDASHNNARIELQKEIQLEILDFLDSHKKFIALVRANLNLHGKNPLY